MGFFDEKYVSDIRRRAKEGKISKLARPAVRLATEPGWQRLRNEIDEFFSRLDSSSQSKLRKRRRDLENISQTVNELKVGMYLVALGWSVEYEKDLNGITPDWFVTDRDGKQSFVVEVFSKRDSDDKHLEEEYLSDLRDLVREIKIGALLTVRLYTSDQVVRWSDALVSDISIALRCWLEKKPSRGEIINVGGVEIEFGQELENIDHVELLTASNAFWVNPAPVSQTIADKVARYSSMCSKLSMPFFAACCPSFSTAIEKEEFEQICPNLFAAHTELTGVLAFIERRVEVFMNSSSKYRVELN